MPRTFSIGRSPECELTLSDDSVSRKHAEIQILDDGKIFLTDCDSTNGTLLVQGDQLIPLRQDYVDVGDTVILGEYEIRIRDLLDDINRLFPPQGGGSSASGAEAEEDGADASGGLAQAETPAPDKPWVAGEKLMRCTQCGAVARPGEPCAECGYVNL